MRFYLFLLTMPLLAAFAFNDCNRSAPRERTIGMGASSDNANKTADANAAAISTQQQQDNSKRISLADAKKAFDAGTVVFVDTRGAANYNAKHIKGALNITADEIGARADELKRTNKQIVAYCS